MPILVAHDAELRDLTEREPLLVDAASGCATGVRLVRWLGAGGMASVFEGRLEPDERSDDLSPHTPRRLAIKLMKPLVARELGKTPGVVEAFFKRELVALGRVMERRPSTEFVVACYGSGLTDVRHGEEVARVPWLALELVDGGGGGVSLTERVRRHGAGLGPMRALRLVRGIVEGVRVLHAEQIFHRDLKPENVLVVGPAGDETPKLADCGIARVEGVAGTVGGMTLAYGAPEQRLSAPGVRNPLIGAWTDVHALAAVVWFILAGEDWCQGENDGAWMQGERRSLGEASGLDPALRGEASLLAAIDAALRKGASPRLPDAQWNAEARLQCEQLARRFLPAMFQGLERFVTVDELAQALLPPLEAAARAAAARGVPPARPSEASLPPSSEPRELVTSDRRQLCLETSLHLALAERPLGLARLAAFQPDGSVLALFGERLLVFTQGYAHEVPVHGLEAVVASSRWLLRGAAGGYLLVGPEDMVHVGGGALPRLLPRPPLAAIEAAASDGATVVLGGPSPTGDGPALVTLEPSGGYRELDVPAALAGFTLVALASGSGAVAVLASQGDVQRLALVGRDRTPSVVGAPAAGTLVGCGAGGELFLVAEGGVYRWDGTAFALERVVPALGETLPSAVVFDVRGAGWLLSPHALYRRAVSPVAAVWQAVHLRAADEAALAALGVTPRGVRLFDVRGDVLELERPARAERKG